MNTDILIIVSVCVIGLILLYFIYKTSSTILQKIDNVAAVQTENMKQIHTQLLTRLMIASGNYPQQIQQSSVEIAQQLPLSPEETVQQEAKEEVEKSQTKDETPEITENLPVEASQSPLYSTVILSMDNSPVEPLSPTLREIPQENTEEKTEEQSQEINPEPLTDTVSQAIEQSLQEHITEAPAEVDMSEIKQQIADYFSKTKQTSMKFDTLKEFCDKVNLQYEISEDMHKATARKILYSLLTEFMK